MIDGSEPTELTRADIDQFIKNFDSGMYDIKPKTCYSCGTKCFINYGHAFGECDECFFARWPKEERMAFFRSFFE